MRQSEYIWTRWLFGMTNYCDVQTKILALFERICHKKNKMSVTLQNGWDILDNRNSNDSKQEQKPKQTRNFFNCLASKYRDVQFYNSKSVLQFETSSPIVKCTNLVI